MSQILTVDSPFQIGNTKHLATLRDMLAFGNGVQTRAFTAAAAGATSIALGQKPLGMEAGLGWIVLKPYTTECMIRKAEVILDNTVSWTTPLDYEVSINDPVLWITEPIINAKWFGAKGDGVTNDYTALQRFFNVSFGSGMNKYATYYLPAGNYRVNSSLNLTNKWYFRVVGDAWGQSKIVGYASGKPVLDMLGARMFEIDNLTVAGDATSTPSVALFFGRTTVSPNCGNCFISNLTLDGKFSVAAIYSVNAEVFSISKLRSGPNYLHAPYVYYADGNNALGVTSDYDTISYTYTGASQMRFSDWWINTSPSVAATCFRIANGNWHGASIKDIYCNLYGGTGYLFSHSGSTQGLEIDNLYGEGSYAGGLRFDGAQIAQFEIKQTTLKGLYTGNSSYLKLGVISHCNPLDSNATITFERIDWCEIKHWWNISNQNIVITSGVGNYIEDPDGSSVTITSGSGNVIQQVNTSPHPFTVPALRLGWGAGSYVTKFLKATVNLDFPSISANSESALTMSVPGAAYGNFAWASPRTGLETGIVIKAVNAETDTVRITLRNVTGSAIDPAAKDWTAVVIG